MSDLPDLDCPEQISKLVHAFYARVRVDELLGPVFEEQARVDWVEHMPKLTAFWCKLEFDMPGFTGSPTAKHSELSRLIPFRSEQFGRWVELFHDTIDRGGDEDSDGARGWAGPHAESIKARAVHIAQRQSRVVERSQPWFGLDGRRSPR